MCAFYSTAESNQVLASLFPTSGRNIPNPLRSHCSKVGGCRQVRHRKLILCKDSNTSESGKCEDERRPEIDLHFQLPEELQGLTISGDGQYLLDSRTGQTINEFGATRFDVAVRALRGDFDPPQDVENTERCDNILIGALKQFPLTYTFNIVLKGGQDPEEMKRFVSDTLMSVSGSSYHECQLSERLNGKYVSVKASACMQSPDMIASVFQELGKDPRVVMKY